MVIRIWVRFMKKGVSICFGGALAWSLPRQGGSLSLLLAVWATAYG